MHLCVQCIHSRISHQPCNPIQMPCSRLTRFADQCTFVWIRIRIFIMKEMSPVPLGHYKTKIIEKSKIFVVVRLYSTSNFLLFFFISLDPAEIHQPGIPAWSGHLVHPHPQVSRVPYIAQKKYLSKNVVCESAYTILCTPNALRYVYWILLNYITERIPGTILVYSKQKKRKWCNCQLRQIIEKPCEVQVRLLLKKKIISTYTYVHTVHVWCPRSQTFLPLEGYIMRCGGL